MNTNYSKLHPLGLGLAFGILGGLSVLIIGLFASYGYTHAEQMVPTLSTFYYGFEATVKGSFMGFVMSFICHFVYGVLTAWIYNCVSCCCGYMCGAGKKK